MAKGLDALELLRQDHARVEQLFRRFERSRGADDQAGLIEDVCTALTEHADLEEQLFYPIVLDMTSAEQLMEEADIEHASIRRLIDELRDGKAQGARHLALFQVLMEYVRHHVREEEARIFPLVKKTGIDLQAFGEELAEGKGEASGRKAGAGSASGGRQRARRVASEQEQAGQAMRRAEEPAPARRAASLRRSAKGERRENGNGEDRRAHTDPSVEDNQAYREAHKEGLSKTTLRAKWINSPEEHEDRPGQSLATRSHDVIRRWAEERRAAPATAPGGDAQRPRVLRFNFPGYDKSLQEVSWDVWFGSFDERDLVFIYQEHMKAGNPSNFFKLDSPGREHE
jgi:hemerythrin superfamily protein